MFRFSFSFVLCAGIVVAQFTNSSVRDFDALENALQTLGCLNNSNCPLANLKRTDDCLFDLNSIQCDANGDVVFLSLYGATLSGSLNGISALTALRFIDLANNSIAGQLPANFTALSNLYYLNLAINRITGTIPSVWTQLTSLGVMFIHANQLVGQVPNFTANTFDFGLCVIQNDLFRGNCVNTTSGSCEENDGQCQCEKAGAICGSSSTTAATATATTTKQFMTSSSSSSSSLSSMNPTVATTTTTTKMSTAPNQSSKQLVSLIDVSVVYIVGAILGCLLLIAIIVIVVLLVRGRVVVGAEQYNAPPASAPYASLPKSNANVVQPSAYVTLPRPENDSLPRLNAGNNSNYDDLSLRAIEVPAVATQYREWNDDRVANDKDDDNYALAPSATLHTQASEATTFGTAQPSNFRK